jgi:hypothetical protein
METKLSFAGNLTSAVGHMVNYGAHLAHNCNERKVVKGVIFDKHKFYFAYMNYGKLSRLIECKRPYAPLYVGHDPTFQRFTNNNSINADFGEYLPGNQIRRISIGVSLLHRQILHGNNDTVY